MAARDGFDHHAVAETLAVAAMPSLQQAGIVCSTLLIHVQW